MKYGMNLKYSLPLLLLAWMAFGMGACISEELNVGGDENYSSVTIKVKMPEQTVKDPMSRGVAADYDEVRNMNIMVSDKGFIKKRVYLDFANMTWGDGTTTITNGSSSGGVTITYKDVDGFRLFELAFADDYWTAADGSSIPLKTCQFHAVANWDGQITDSDDRDLVANLRRLKATEEYTDGDPFCPNKNIMYGEIVKEESKVIDEANPAEKERVVTIGLNRTVAMITLAMNGEELAQGVMIELTNVALYNVPTSCFLGKPNIAGKEGIGVCQKGELVGGSFLARGTLVGTDTKKNMANFSGDQYRTTIGGHYDMENGTVKVDYNSTVMPLFLYENMQGEGEPVEVEDQSMKRPKGVAATEAAIVAYNETGVCSYIEINATYTHYDNDMSILEEGPVTWRFFLGKNETTDFNVERNTNYRLTLVLTGTGIGEANASWRVDAALKKPAVVGDTTMVVGGGGEMFCVQPNRDIATDYSNGLKLKGSGADFVYVYTKPNSKYVWEQVSVSTGNTNPAEASPDGKQIWFYVQPLLPEDPYSGNERTCTVNFLDNSGKDLNPPLFVTFTQYRPVTFSITPADLSGPYKDDPDLLEAKRLIEEYYNHDFENGGGFTFYADRVDRGPLQWGFSKVQLDKNQNSGFENVYHLIDPLDADGNSIADGNSEYANCLAHKEYAKNYLPTGRGWNDKNGHIDYENGSCMMHAAMENYFQQYYPYPGGTYNGETAPMVTPQQLAGMTTLPSRPVQGDNTENDRSYSWCVPSIVGWKLVEILDRFYKNHNDDRGFDPKYPVSKWFAYWTSNAATKDMGPDGENVYPGLQPPIDGKNRSFVYRFGIGLDKIKEDGEYPGYLLMDRTSKVRYRLLNIRPESSVK